MGKDFDIKSHVNYNNSLYENMELTKFQIEDLKKKLNYEQASSSLREAFDKALDKGMTGAEASDLYSKFLHGDFEYRVKQPENRIPKPLELVAGLLGGFLGACTGIEVNVNDKDEVTLVTKEESSDQEILEELKKLNSNFNTLAAILTENNIKLDRIVSLLSQLGASIEEIAVSLAYIGSDATEIINLIKENNENQDTIINALANGNEKIAVMLDKILASINNGNELSKENNKLLTLILNKITSVEALDLDGNALLTQILSKVTESVENNKKMDEKTVEFYNNILAKFDSMTEATKNGFNDLGNKFDTLTEEQKDFAIKLLAKLEKMTEDMQTGFANVLEQISSLKDYQLEFAENVIANLNNFVNNMKDALGNVLAKLHTMQLVQIDLVDQILEHIDDMDANLQGGFADVVAKIETLDTNHQEFVNNLLAKLDGLPAAMKDNYADLLTAIAENTAIDSDILDKLSELTETVANLTPGQASDLSAVISAIEALGENVGSILTEIQNGNSQLDAIREAIVANTGVATGIKEAIEAFKATVSEENKAILDNISAGNATLAEIKTLIGELKDLKAVETKDYTDVLNLILAAINNLIAQENTFDTDTKNRLLEILAKIPAKCDCKHETVDLSGILDKLDQLIESAKSEDRDDPKHEGILDDLEDLLG